MRTVNDLQDLRDMAKATLPEPQSPAMLHSSLDYRIYAARSSVHLPMSDSMGKIGSSPIKGNLSADGR